MHCVGSSHTAVEERAVFLLFAEHLFPVQVNHLVADTNIVVDKAVHCLVVIHCTCNNNLRFVLFVKAAFLFCKQLTDFGGVAPAFKFCFQQGDAFVFSNYMFV